MSLRYVESAHGKLACPKKTYGSQHYLPRLQFEDGDLLIKLSDKTEDWLLLHSAVVAAVCPVLGAGSSQAWAETADLDTITHPSTGREVSVRTLALKAVDGTYLLEGKTFNATGDLAPFQNSGLAEQRWPEIRGQCILKVTIRTFRVFFSLLYGAQLSTADICGFEEVSHFGHYMMNNYVIHIVAGVCAYAQYYQCFDYISPLIVGQMQSAPGFWGAVASEPKVHLWLAKKLELRDVYADALRHLVAAAYHNRDQSELWSVVAEELNAEEDLVRAFFKPQLEILEEKIDMLKLELSKLQMFPNTAFWGSYHPVHTTFGNFLQLLRPNRSAAKKQHEATEFLARSMFGQWLLAQEHGKELELAEKGRKREVKKPGLPSRFNLAVLKIEAAAAAGKAGPVFSVSTLTDVVDSFNFATWFKRSPSRLLEQKIMMVINEAYEIIKRILYTHGEAWVDEIWPTPVISGRAHYDAHVDGYFTFMKIPDSVPWTEKTEANEQALLVRPDVDMTDASEVLMKVLVEHLGDRDRDDEIDSEGDKTDGEYINEQATDAQEIETNAKLGGSEY